MNAIKLSEAELALIERALRVAAEVYRKDANTPGLTLRLGDQFILQAEQAEGLADRIEAIDG